MGNSEKEIVREKRGDVDGSRLASLTPKELLELLSLRVSKCVDTNPCVENAFRDAARVVEVLNAWIVSGRGDQAASSRWYEAKFLPDLYMET